MRMPLSLFVIFALSLCLGAAAQEETANGGTMEMTIVTEKTVEPETVAPAVTEELTAEQIKELKEAQRLENIKNYVWAGLYLTMPFSDATNVMSGALEFKAPEYPYKIKAYMVAAVDDMSGSTNKQILTARRLFFDKDDKLLALEHIFNGLTVDQKNYLMNMYSRKYTMIPLQAKDHSWFKVTDGVMVLVEFVESQTRLNIYGWHTPDEYSVRAIYYMDKEFVSLINRSGMAMLPPEVAHP